MKKLLTFFLVFALASSLAVSAFAADGETAYIQTGATIPSNILAVAASHEMKGGKTDYHIWKHKTESKYLVCYTNEPAVCWQSSGKHYIGGHVNSFIETCNYVLLDANAQTIETYSDDGIDLANKANSTLTGANYSIGYSTKDVRSYTAINGVTHALFFRRPLLLGETVAGLTQEAGNSLEAQVSGTAALLATCGVSCLALLTALVLLRKKFLTFLH